MPSDARRPKGFAPDSGASVAGLAQLERVEYWPSPLGLALVKSIQTEGMYAVSPGDRRR